MRRRRAGAVVVLIAAVALGASSLSAASGAVDRPPAAVLRAARARVREARRAAVELARSAAAAAAPLEVISPLPGTPDADPSTQISFLGAPASRIENVVVRGSRSGRHYGRLEYYSTHTGGSFVPTRPFVAGEHVTVSATVVGYGAVRRVGTSFDVDSPYVLPQPTPAAPVKVTATNVLRFHSRPDLEPPAVTVTTPAADPTLGDIFISPEAGPGQAGPMIVSPSGTLLWFQPVPAGEKAFNLNLQTYDGAPVLTWWQGDVVEGHGQGVDVIDSAAYKRVATVHAGNGLYADLHDFQVTPAGTAWITAFIPQHADLSAYGGRADGLLDDGAVQEIDIRTGLVMFQWNALAHVAIPATYMHAPRWPGKVLDYFHVNSIDPLPDGDMLISSRNTWALYLVSQTTGAVIWRLGGKDSSFTLDDGLRFAWQHDAQVLPDGTISLFDNGDRTSRALVLNVDEKNRRVTMRRAYTHPEALFASSQGNVQTLPNGNVLVGWGAQPYVSEFTPDGTMIFDAKLDGPGLISYRAYRAPWQGAGDAHPRVTLVRGSRTTDVYVSWNGDTRVTHWTVHAGRRTGELRPIGSVPRSGFETGLRVPARFSRIRVIGSDAAGRRIGASPTLTS